MDKSQQLEVVLCRVFPNFGRQQPGCWSPVPAGGAQSGSVLCFRLLWVLQQTLVLIHTHQKHLQMGNVSMQIKLVCGIFSLV